MAAIADPQHVPVDQVDPGELLPEESEPRGRRTRRRAEENQTELAQRIRAVADRARRDGYDGEVRTRQATPEELARRETPVPPAKVTVPGLRAVPSTAREDVPDPASRGVASAAAGGDIPRTGRRSDRRDAVLELLAEHGPLTTGAICAALDWTVTAAGDALPRYRNGGHIVLYDRIPGRRGLTNVWALPAAAPAQLDHADAEPDVPKLQGGGLAAAGYGALLEHAIRTLAERGRAPAHLYDRLERVIADG